MNRFFCNDTATTEIYTLSLHDALPIYADPRSRQASSVALRPRKSRAQVGLFGATLRRLPRRTGGADGGECGSDHASRSEEHTSELQSRQYLVCRLLLEKKITMKRTR